MLIADSGLLTELRAAAGAAVQLAEVVITATSSTGPLIEADRLPAAPTRCTFPNRARRAGAPCALLGVVGRDASGVVVLGIPTRQCYTATWIWSLPRR